MPSFRILELWVLDMNNFKGFKHIWTWQPCWSCDLDHLSSDSLLSKLGLQDIDVVLRSSRMRWYGHVERSKGWIAQVRKLNIVAQKRSGKPRKSWDEVLLDDRKKLGMNTADPQNRSEWRGRLRRRLVKQVQPSVEDNGL